jgi:predicted nucleotidyltransferase
MTPPAESRPAQNRPDVPAPHDRIVIEQWLPEAVERIRATVHPEQIVLFGSYAHGTPTPDSDVDLLVILDAPGTRAERYQTIAAALRPRRFAVDLIVRTPAEVARARARGNAFIQAILDHGRILYERQP